MANIQAPKDLGRLSVIKQEIEKTFGRTVSSYGDCLSLSEAITTKTGYTLNVNTLRRLFGLVPYNGFPSRTTLNILSLYCGFASFEKVKPTTSVDTQQRKLEDEVIELFSHMFRAGNAEGYQKSYYRTVENTLKFLHRNHQLLGSFIDQIVKADDGRHLYFNKFINIDGLNSYYGNGLLALLEEPIEPDEHLLVHSLLVFRYWLTQEDAKVNLYYRQLAKYTPAPTTSQSTLAWFYIARLCHAAIKDVSIQPVLAEMRHCFQQINEAAQPWAGRLSFDFICCRALALLGYYEESQFYLDWTIRHQLNHRGQESADLLQSILLVEALIQLQTKKRERLAFIMQKIDPSKFHFLSAKLEGILYAFIRYAHDHHSGNALEDFEAFINETGFSRLQGLPSRFFKLNNN